MGFTQTKDQSGVAVLQVEGQLIVGNRQELKELKWHCPSTGGFQYGLKAVGLGEGSGTRETTRPGRADPCTSGGAPCGGRRFLGGAR